MPRRSVSDARSVEPVRARADDAAIDHVPGEELVIDERIRSADGVLAVLAPDAELATANGSLRAVREPHAVAVQGVGGDGDDLGDGADRA